MSPVKSVSWTVILGCYYKINQFLNWKIKLVDFRLDHAQMYPYLPFIWFVFPLGEVHSGTGAQRDPQEGNLGRKRPASSGLLPQGWAQNHGTSLLQGGEPQGRKSLVLAFLLPPSLILSRSEMTVFPVAT